MPIERLIQESITRVQVVDEHGNLDQALVPDLPTDKLIGMYRAMVLSREVDERGLKLQRQGRMGTFAPAIGQEAASVGPVFAMTEQDWFVPAFREQAGWFARGMPVENFFLFYNGYEEGNLATPKGRNLPPSIIVASQLLHAVGIGYAMKLRQEKDSAVVSFFGDGATSEGDFHEALNFAGVWQAPVVFICQNNQWAISVPLSKQTSSKTLAQKAIAYDIPGVQVDGNDVLAMYRTAKEALQRARRGLGPTLIEAVTYRVSMHTTADDPTKYRSDEEVAPWHNKDPIRRFQKYLEQADLLNQDEDHNLRQSVKNQVAEAVRSFEAHQDRFEDAAFEHVFGTQHPEIEDQRKQFLADLERKSSNA